MMPARRAGSPACSKEYTHAEGHGDLRDVHGCREPINDAYLSPPGTSLCMWSEIIREFSDSPSQAKVAKFLLENGFSVNERGRISCNGLEIPSTQVAKALQTDRRVVDATAQRILSLPLHRTIFSHLRVTPDLSRVAGHLGLSVMTIYPEDATRKGIVSDAVRVISGAGLSIRQIYVTDPLLSEDPRLVVIIDGDFPASVIEDIRHLPEVRKIVL